MIARSRSKIITIVVLALILCVLGFLTYHWLSPNGMFAHLQKDLLAIQPTEEVAYYDLEGNRVDLNEFRGQLLVINSWATWIPFSKDELVLLENAKQRYGDQITVIAMNRKEDRALISSYLETFGISGGVIQLSDPEDNFYKAVGGYAAPETAFYAKDGTMQNRKRGVLTEEELNGFIDSLIQEGK